MSDLELLLGGLLSSFGVGWAMGRWIKSIRQFFDQI
jgi:hypothetical protein